MKIIDLLNKIANGEEVPEKVNYEDVIFELKNGDLLNDIGCSLFEHRGDGVEKLLPMLNDEVEIIEEEKGIPEKIRWHEVNGVGEEDDAFYVDVNGKSQYVDSEYDSWEMTTILKINEIIDYLQSKGE